MAVGLTSPETTLGKQLPPDIKVKLREWLESFEGYTFEAHPGTDVEWGFKLISPNECTIEVYQPINRVDYIAVSGKWELVATLKNLCSQLTDAAKAQLYFELRMEMFRSECRIEVDFVDRIPQWFRVIMPIFADALTQDALFHRISRVHSTGLLLLAIINRAALNYAKKPASIES